MNEGHWGLAAGGGLERVLRCKQRGYIIETSGGGEVGERRLRSENLDTVSIEPGRNQKIKYTQSDSVRSASSMGRLQRKAQSGLRDSKLRQILHHGAQPYREVARSGADTKDTDMAVQVGVGEGSCGICQPGLEDWREIISKMSLIIIISFVS